MAVTLLALLAGRALPTEICSGSHFCQSLSKAQVRSGAARIRSIEKMQ
jgi:hypothetical protein